MHIISAALVCARFCSVHIIILSRMLLMCVRMPQVSVCHVHAYTNTRLHHLHTVCVHYHNWYDRFCGHFVPIKCSNSPILLHVYVILVCIRCKLCMMYDIDDWWTISVADLLSCIWLSRHLSHEKTLPVVEAILHASTETIDKIGAEPWRVKNHMLVHICCYCDCHWIETPFGCW